ncbi:MAG: DNA-directed RNA polymerase subunit RPC12/RpoP [Planctomycetota bacterium]
MSDEITENEGQEALDGETIQSEIEVSASPNVEFACEECGADMTWDPASDALSCEFCGHKVEVPRGEGLIVERKLDEAPDVERGLGLKLRVANCNSCGARVTFDEKATADICVYCGSANVLAQEANRNSIRPESLVPLDISHGEVTENFKKWVKGLWFRPNALKQTKKFQAVGIYVPYWTFDAKVHSDWSADAGYYYYVTQTYTTMVNGKMVVRTRQVRKVRWRPAWGKRDDHFDDHLTHASSGQPADLVRELGRFDTSELVPYKPAYLAGWHAEEYSVDLEEGWVQAQKEIGRIQEERCSGDVPGDTQRNLRVQNFLSEIRWKHVLLPIWSLQYKLHGKVFTVLVHGQSGKVVGNAPYSWIKITLFSLIVLGLVAGGFAVFGAAQ